MDFEKRAREIADSVWLATFERSRLARQIQEALRDASASTPPEGWKLVPVEPTPQMIDAGRYEMPAEVDYWQQRGVLRAQPRPLNECVPPGNVYTAMLSASPSPPEKG